MQLLILGIMPKEKTIGFGTLAVIHNKTSFRCILLHGHLTILSLRVKKCFANSYVTMDSLISMPSESSAIQGVQIAIYYTLNSILSMPSNS
jgi:hypothetical protein